MNLSSIDKKIEILADEIQEKDQKDRLFHIKKLYEGPDQIITAEEYKDQINKEKVLYKVKSGINGLDKLIEGFRPGTLIIISGPTKQGKTTFCQTLTYHFTLAKFPCLWFSFDTPPIELIERFPTLPVFYLPRKNSPEKRLEWIEGKIIEGLAKFNTRIIFIDHLEFLSKFSEGNNSNYANEITAIARELKEISIRWNVTIFLNHHIRQIPPGTTPHWSHLKNSSGPAQESDITIMIWRLEEKTAMGSIQSDRARVAVQLHRRTGKTGIFDIDFQNNIFKDYDKNEERPF